MSEQVLYILMRNDLPSMNTGKAMAQASHASNQFIHEHGKDRRVKEWQNSTLGGFGTVLVLSANLDQIDEAMLKANGFLRGDVVDPTYPYRTDAEVAKLIPSNVDTSPRIVNGNTVTLFRREQTCAYIFGGREELKPYIGHLPLHP